MENPVENGDIKGSAQEQDKSGAIEAEKYKHEANVFFKSE
jgi:hypothetical protein